MERDTHKGNMIIEFYIIYPTKINNEDVEILKKILNN